MSVPKAIYLDSTLTLRIVFSVSSWSSFTPSLKPHNWERDDPFQLIMINTLNKQITREQNSDKEGSDCSITQG